MHVHNEKQRRLKMFNKLDGLRFARVNIEARLEADQKSVQAQADAKIAAIQARVEAEKQSLRAKLDARIAVLAAKQRVIEIDIAQIDRDIANAEFIG
jgi:hypothetical protein